MEMQKKSIDERLANFAAAYVWRCCKILGGGDR